MDITHIASHAGEYAAAAGGVVVTVIGGAQLITRGLAAITSIWPDSDVNKLAKRSHRAVCRLQKVLGRIGLDSSTSKKRHD